MERTGLIAISPPPLRSLAAMALFAFLAPSVGSAQDASSAPPSSPPLWPVPAAVEQLVPGSGRLWAQFVTTEGSFDCELFEAEAPDSVAFFVALARGRRAWFDKEPPGWTERAYYRDLAFHRREPGFLIGAGGLGANGREHAGVWLPFEGPPGVEHHRGAGVLGLQNAGRDRHSSRFYVTLAPAPYLDGRNTALGLCPDLTVPRRIAAMRRKVPRLLEVRVARRAPELETSSPPAEKHGSADSRAVSPGLSPPRPLR